LELLSIFQPEIWALYHKSVIHHDPFAGYSSERPKPSQKYVPMEDLNKIMNTPLKSKSLNAVRDLFVFSCFTGLAYVDLCNLTNQQIVKTDDGTFWLHTSTQIFM